MPTEPSSSTQIIPDRRQSPRFSWNATAALKTRRGIEAARVRVLGLGIAGCRVVINRPLHPEDEFELTIQAENGEIVTNVVVKYWNSRGFAGLHFTSMTADARKHLESLVALIARTSMEPESGPPP